MPERLTQQGGARRRRIVQSGLCAASMSRGWATVREVATVTGLTPQQVLYYLRQIRDLGHARQDAYAWPPRWAPWNDAASS